MKESLTSYIRLKELILESLSTSPKKNDCDCDCDCGGCADKTKNLTTNK